MSGVNPYDQLIGSLNIWIAPYGETIPAINVTPGGNFRRLGPTDGGQTIKHVGDLEKRSDDDHTEDILAFRPAESLTVTATVVGLTLENYASIINNPSHISTGVSPATKTMPLKKGFYPSEWVMLLRGDVLSPEGVLPGMYVIPRGVFGGEPEVAMAKDERAGMEFEFSALGDDDQTDERKRLGWLVIQTS